MLKIFSVLILISLSSCTAYYNAFYTDPDKCYLAAQQTTPYDAIIVPGFPSDSGEINGILSERILWANHLYTKGITKHIIFSGSAVYTPYFESKIMRAYALQTEIDPQHIFVETKAEHTTENVYFGYVMARELGFQRIAFATHPAQSSFMKPFRRKFKLNFDFLPIVSDSIGTFDFMQDTLQTLAALQPGFVSIEEREGFFKRMGGTRGKRVRKEIRMKK